MTLNISTDILNMMSNAALGYFTYYLASKGTFMKHSLIRVDVFVRTPDSPNALAGSVFIPVPESFPNFQPSELSLSLSAARTYSDDSAKPIDAKSFEQATETKPRRGRRKGQPTWVEAITAALGKKSLGTAAILKNIEASGRQIDVDNPKRYIGHLLSVHSKGRGAPFARVRGERGVYRVR